MSGIQKANYEHIDGILGCLSDAFSEVREAYSAEAYADTVLTPGTLKERLDEMDNYVYLDEEGEVIGFVGWKKESEEEAHIRGMAVSPAGRGQGVARTLLSQVDDDVRSAGCSFISLDTTEYLQSAIKLYERNGFERSGKTDDFYGMTIHEFIKRI